MHITNIEKLPRKKNRIYIDGEFAFMLYDRDMEVYHIPDGGTGEDFTDIEISEAQFERIMKETVTRRAHQKALNLLESMDRSEDELRRRLKLDMYGEGVIDETVNWLKGLHYLDDERYAQSYIRGRIANTSRQELRTRLLAKGIERDLIDEAYEVCSEELRVRPGAADERDAEDTDIEQQAAVKTLKKKLGSKRALTPKERMSIIGYMLRKGFGRSRIQAAFDTLGISIGYDDIPE